MGKLDADLVSRQNNDSKRNLRKLTSRKRPGTFKEIIKKINQITVGWINYYGIANMKKFHRGNPTMVKSSIKTIDMEKMEENHEQDITMLRKYGIDHDDAMKLANSRKGYWRISRSEILHRAITKERLIKWGLKDMSQLYERDT